MRIANTFLAALNGFLVAHWLHVDDPFMAAVNVAGVLGALLFSAIPNQLRAS